MSARLNNCLLSVLEYNNFDIQRVTTRHVEIDQRRSGSCTTAARQSGHVDLTRNHVSMQAVWNPWPQPGTSRPISPSPNSTRHTAHSAFSAATCTNTGSCVISFSPPSASLVPPATCDGQEGVDGGADEVAALMPSFLGASFLPCRTNRQKM